jgi:hypothetical protein
MNIPFPHHAGEETANAETVGGIARCQNFTIRDTVHTALPLTPKPRLMKDGLIDELVKGKAMEKILRK